MTARRRRPARHRLRATARRCSPDIVYCNTCAYGLEGPLAHFGGLDPLDQAAAGLEYEPGPVAEGNAPLYYRFGMCDAPTRCSRSSAARRALPPRTAPARARSCGRRCSTAACSSPPTRCSPPTANPSTAPALDREQPGLDALLPPLRDAGRLDPDRGGPRRALARAAACCDARARRRPRASPRLRPHEHRASSTALLAEAFMADLATNWRRALGAAGVPTRDPDRHLGRRADPLRRRQRAPRSRRRVRAPAPRSDAPVRQPHQVLRHARSRSDAAAPRVGEHTREILD